MSPRFEVGGILARTFPSSGSSTSVVRVEYVGAAVAVSRLIEKGWPVHHVKEMLAHKDLSQTSTYLNATVTGLHESMRKFDEPA